MLLGERIGMDQQVVANRKQNLPRIVQGYDKKDIYGTWTRVGFSGKGVPNRNLVYQGGKCKGSKLAKERLTITFLCSTVGEKFKFLVIGKSQMLKAFNKQLP
jgi:hypothetical protein